MSGCEFFGEDCERGWEECGRPVVDVVEVRTGVDSWEGVGVCAEHGEALKRDLEGIAAFAAGRYRVAAG